MNKLNKNFVLIKDNFLSFEKCDYVIKKYKDKTTKKDSYSGYNSYFIKEYNFLTKLPEMINEYIEFYPESFLTPYRWTLDEIRFKHFKPGNYYKDFHCEHGYDNNKRVLNFMIYLSDHNCGTEFYTGEIIKSVKGRAVMFPAYFTHLHRGQPCPDKLDRYILGGYFNYENNIG